MSIERNEPIHFHVKGTLDAVTRWIATHSDGIAEWLKNGRRQYQIDRAYDFSGGATGHGPPSTIAQRPILLTGNLYHVSARPPCTHQFSRAVMRIS